MTTMTKPNATIQFDKWPELLGIVRHGYSTANEKKDLAKQNGQEPAWIGVTRDQDAELTPLGHQQAFELGKWMKGEKDRWDFIVTSPYRRAKQTTEEIIKGLDYKPVIVVEERIREIEFGIMDGIDRHTFRSLYPREADR